MNVLNVEKKTFFSIIITVRFLLCCWLILPSNSFLYFILYIMFSLFTFQIWLFGWTKQSLNGSKHHINPPVRTCIHRPQPNHRIHISSIQLKESNMLPLTHRDHRSLLYRIKSKLNDWKRLIFSDRNSRNLFLFLLLNLSFAFVELFYGIATNSLGKYCFHCTLLKLL